ncbi:MAG TPA: DNA repair protein RecO C-terminal domain-containing protein [Bacteroidia bacterium]|jgi:DNA repair protein RecO (recombination protein O)|nr:DNA repair protein RecO C-terminal domain-containing protein [Bacteroidia bacterium]
MQQKTNGIILQNTKFQDKKNILKIYTLQHGVQSYVINIGHSKKSKIKSAHVIGLNQIEFIEQIKKTRSIQLISDIHVSYIYQNLFSNPIKNTIGIFLNEVLLKALKEQPENHELYQFVSESLIVFDNQNYEASNFHLHFLVELSKHLGFYPNNNYSEKNCLFDIQDGIFTAHIPTHLHYADSELSFHLSKLLNDKSNFTCNAKTRADLLNLLLMLYKLHVPNFGEIKSIQILKEILA